VHLCRFGLTLLKITDYRTNHYLYLLPFLGVAGVFITWCYNRFGSDSAKGMALLFEIHQDKRSSIPLRLIPFAVGSTWLTHCLEAVRAAKELPHKSAVLGQLYRE